MFSCCRTFFINFSAGTFVNPVGQIRCPTAISIPESILRSEIEVVLQNL